MNTEKKIPLRPSYPWHFFALIVTTVFAIAVSLYYLNAGRFIVFQNLFYFPIIIACVYYLRKGFVFSVLMAFFYSFLILAYTSNSTIIREAFIRVAIFIMVAGVISFLSLKQKRSEEGQNRVRSWQEGINRILGLVLEPVLFDEKLKRITDGIVETFGADFCRIWLIDKGDLCNTGCMHAEVLEGPHVCRYCDKCLHLKASSGRYTHIDGKTRRRVPFGAYKIGRIASGEEIRFLTNDVQRDPGVPDHEWAKSLGLVAFAGYRLRPPDGETLGALALFAKFEISPDMDSILEGLSRAVALVIQKDIAEQSLQKSYALLKCVLESSKEVVIFALDRQYRYIAFNKNHHQTMKRIWGVDIALGNSMLEYIKNPDDCLKAKNNFDRALSGESFTLVEAYGDIALERRCYEDIYNPIIDRNGNVIGLTLFLTDITDRRQTEEERERLILELRQALSEIKTLSGLLPICGSCKKIRNDKGYWEQMEIYIRDHSEADFSHGICPECAEKLYPEYYKKK